MATILITFNFGLDIKDCFVEAQRLANLLSVIIEFKFNDTTCFAYADGDAEKGAVNYLQAKKIKESRRIATNK